MFEQFRVLGHPVRAGIELFRALYTIIDAVAVCFIAGTFLGAHMLLN